MNIRKMHAIHHLREYTTIYIFMIILFLTGIIFGAVIVNSMNFVQKQDLFFYLDRFFNQMSDHQLIQHHEIFKDSFLYHMKYLSLLFLLGLSVIGLPIVWILIFFKGLVVGFTVGFIVNQLGFKGFLLATLSIAPHNLITIPIYLVAGSLSMIFSLVLFRKLFSQRISQPIFAPFKIYVSVFSVLLVFSIVASFLEAFVAHEAMQLFVKSIYS